MGEEAVAQEQSPNWEASTRLRELPEGTGYHKDWPYHEGFPQYPWIGAEFEVVTAWGKRCVAIIDTSTQYRSEGVQWRIPEGRGYRNINSIDIAGWRRM